MSEILLYYRRPDPTTWVYLSSFLTIGLYFVFHRFWSVRNLDLVLLILLAPGLLIVHEGRERELRELESQAIAQRRSDEQKQDATPSVEATQAPRVDQSRDERRRQAALGGGGDDVVDAVDIAMGAAAALSDATPVLVLMQTGTDRQKPVAIEAEELSLEPQRRGAPRDGTQRADLDANRPDESRPEGPAGKETERTNGETMTADLTAEAIDDSADQVQLGAESSSSDEPFSSQDIQRYGFISLFLVQMMILVRLLVDSLMVRRPLLDPNLTTGGLNFISISLFLFMMANVVNSTPKIQVTQGPELGPGYALMNMLPAIPTRPVSDAVGGGRPVDIGKMSASQEQLATIAKIMAILAHLAIVTGIVLIGNRHFGNLRAGVGAATLYLMLPYTAQMTGRVDHALPAALLLWAVLNYRKPIVAGIFLGLAGGLLYYPLFLLPLWFSFYWRRGAGRFAIGVVSMLVLLTVLLSVSGGESLVTHLRRMYGLFLPTQDASLLQGIWGLGWNPIMRLPVIVAFVILSALFAAWPSPKNLGTLISGSAAVMVAAQFWHGYGGGLYIAWFLPLLLLTIFRPNLQDRVALKVVDGLASPSPSPESV